MGDISMTQVEIGDVKFFYQIQGAGEPLVLLHGLGSSSRDWELQMADLSQHFRVIALDLRGHGRSGKPPGPYSMALFAEDTARVIRNLGAAPAHILGISLGGMVAFQLALDHPEVVRSLVITNSTPDLVPRGWRERLAIGQRFLIVRLLGMKKMGQVLGDRFLPDPEQAELRKIFVERWAENHKPAYLEAMKAVVGWSVRNRLGQIDCPTLVIGADGDYFPTAEKEIYTGLIPGARLVIVENSRHALPAEKPALYNQLVLDFLNTLS